MRVREETGLDQTDCRLEGQTHPGNDKLLPFTFVYVAKRHSHMLSGVVLSCECSTRPQVSVTVCRHGGN